MKDHSHHGHGGHDHSGHHPGNEPGERVPAEPGYPLHPELDPTPTADTIPARMRRPAATSITVRLQGIVIARMPGRAVTLSTADMEATKDTTSTPATIRRCSGASSGCRSS